MVILHIWLADVQKVVYMLWPHFTVMSTINTTLHTLKSSTFLVHN